MAQNAQFQITDTFLALDDEGTTRPLPVTETFWEELASGRFGDFARLVSCFSSTEDWSSWEMHPAGDEVVLLLDGDVELHLERDGDKQTLRLDRSGSCVVVPRGTWHTATVHRPATMLFITPGEGTRHRPRSSGEAEVGDD